jgi:hypothetical protein
MKTFAHKDGYFLYHIGPIDFFQHSVPIEHLARQELDDYFSTGQDKAVYGIAKHGPNKPLGIVEKWEKAKYLIATELNWEGDYRNGEGPCAFVVPVEEGFDVGFVIKQDNNGCTFIASPVELPHLSWLAL